MRWLALLALAALVVSCSGWDDDERFVPYTRWVYVQDSLGLHRYDPRSAGSPPEALGPCTAFDLQDDDLWCLSNGQLQRRDARSGAHRWATSVDSAAYLVCVGQRLIVVATGQQLLLRNRRQPDRLLATLDLEARATAALAVGGQVAVGTATGRLLLIDERARVPRADLALPAAAHTMATDRNYRLRVQLVPADAGGWREAVVDVGGGVVVGQVQEPELRHRFYSPLVRSLYEREWLAEVDWRRDSLLDRWPSIGRVEGVGVDFFMGVAWCWQRGQLRPLDLHTGQIGTGQMWPAKPLQIRFWVEVPGRSRP
jgi:hypothetical protein